MRSKITALFAGLMLCGCAQDAAEPAEPSGTWRLQTTPVCVKSFTFAGDVLTTDVACTLPSGGTAVETRRGAFEVSAGRVYWYVSESSCAWEARRSETFAYELDGATMRINGYAADALPLAGSDSAPRGCLTDDGGFTPSAVVPL